MARLHAVEYAEGRLFVNRTGLWLFIFSGRPFQAATTRRQLSAPELNQILGLGITFVLLTSSLTAYRAERAAVPGLIRNLAATIGLGLVFVVGVIIEWAEAFHYLPPSTAYGTIFLTTTGLHGFHVLTGIIALTFILFLGRDGRFARGNFWPVEGAVKYWHFVDVAWVFVYPTLYPVR